VGLGAELVEQWRDMGPTLWIVAGGAALAWFVLLGVLAALTEPRRVEPGPATLELGGDEPPAVVNLVTGDWDLGHEAVPATLIDLAARKHLAVDQVGEDTQVRVASNASNTSSASRNHDDQLTGYERMVLDHVSALARHTDDGVVPANALTTGPGEDSKRWWRRFRKQVHEDARARGLSRARFSRTVRMVLLTLAALVALGIGIAASSLPDNPDDADDSPVGAMIAFGVVSFGGLAALVAAAEGERDTPEGRASAARWLGLREQLGDDTLFADQPPAAVAIWDRHLAYGAALGLAHGAVRALPLGAESDRVAWSPVGGRWRVVRIRYPRLHPPGWGGHPALVAFLGLVQLVPGVATVGAIGVVLSEVGEVGEDSARTAVGTAGAGVLAVLAAALIARGGWMVYAGVADLVQGRRTVEGRVLRCRTRGSDDDRRWYVAVDDGSTDRIRAWRFTQAPGVRQGATVRADVSPRTGHVRDLEPVPTASTATPTSPTTSPTTSVNAG
jgi:hypothetical protein